MTALRRWWFVGTAVLVVGLVGWAWAPALGWGLTDADGWADVAFAREPFLTQLTSRLTGGVAGSFANFWRPSILVQFWLERRLFGWRAAGWQGFALGEHAVASLCAGWLAAVHARFTGARVRRFATAVAVLFAVHPLADEVVPGTARAIDLLLGVTSFSAAACFVLAQERRRDRRPAVVPAAAAGLLFAAALGAKESALVLVPAAGLWIMLFRVDLPGARRAREVVLVGVPAVLLAAAWLVGRHHVLGGLGGYADTPPDRVATLLGALRIGAIEPFLPSFATVLGPFRGPFAWTALAVAWAALAAAAWRGPSARTVAFGAGWYLLYVGLHGVTASLSRRVWYAPTLPSLFVVVPLLFGARTLPARALATGWLLTFAWGSPVFRRYPEWGELSRADGIWLTPATWDTLRPGTEVWLVDRPFRVDLDPRRFQYWSGLGLCHGEASYSLEAWVDEHWPDRSLAVRTLTGFDLRAPVDAQEVSVQVEDTTLVVRHAGGTRPDWDLRSPFEVDEDGDTLRITPVGSTHRLAVMVWTPRGPVTWTPGTASLSP